MKKFLIFTSITLTLFIIAAFGYSRAKNPPVVPSSGGAPQTSQVPANNEPVNPGIDATLFDSQGGIEASVEGVERVQGKTKITIAFNNHVYDLSQLDLKEKATLGGKRPLAYNVDSSQIGGHHVQGELVFEGDVRGSLILPVVNDITFNFDIR